MSDATFTYDESVIGKEVDVATFEVTRESINTYCRALEETNPLWTDDEAAKRGPYGGIIAPPGYMMTLTARGGPNANVKFGNSGFLGGKHITMLAPVRPGDSILLREQVKEVYAKTGRTGTMVFQIRRASFLRDGEVVAIVDTPNVYRQTDTVATASEPPAERRPSRPLHASTPVEGQRHFEDVEPGDEFESSWTVSREQVEAYVRITSMGGGGGAESYFLNEGAASRSGLERPIAHGGLTTSIALKLVTDWVGEAGWLRSMEATFRRPAMHGDHLRVIGLVTDTHMEDGRGLVKLDVYLENERGERPVQAVAVAELPLRG